LRHFHKILCLPETKPIHGNGHLIRQSILVNILRSAGREAYIVLSPAAIESISIQNILKCRVNDDYVLSYATANEIIKKYMVQVVIDSYDTEKFILSLSNLKIKDTIIVFDDLAYLKKFPKNIIPVIPNICSQHQKCLIEKLATIENIKPIFGNNCVLLDPNFRISTLESESIYYSRLKRMDKATRGAQALKVLVSFGGSNYFDKKEELRDSLKIFFIHLQNQFQHLIHFHSLGNASADICSNLGLTFTFHDWLPPLKLKNLYADSDIYVGAIGYSMWERASMGLPSFVQPISFNQMPYLDAGIELGIHKPINPLISNLTQSIFDMQLSALHLKPNHDKLLSLFL
jgi:spore coat polysaccharide biosynthesis predicted glycosyltransferase SpsG